MHVHKSRSINKAQICDPDQAGCTGLGTSAVVCTEIASRNLSSMPVNIWTGGSEVQLAMYAYIYVVSNTCRKEPTNDTSHHCCPGYTAVEHEHGYTPYTPGGRGADPFEICAMAGPSQLQLVEGQRAMGAKSATASITVISTALDFAQNVRVDGGTSAQV